ncbi:MAG: ABC transporter ATP-binding protein [Deltaproteobacteria bacterium]
MSDIPAISCRGLSKSYNGQVVLSGLDLDILRGETMVVLGRSGSGKSVLLKHLNGLLEADSGEVIFDGITITALSEKQLAPIRKRIGMLFQGGALFDSLSVAENVAFPLREHTRMSADERDQRVATLLEMVDLGGSQQRRPSELSGGMRKRAALARSLALQPEVVLYDEPTTGLDPVTARQINSLIRSLQQQLGHTSVVVTHDLASTAFVADRIAFLYDGRIRQVGSLDSMQQSTDPLIREFLAGGPLHPIEAP